MTSPNSVSYLGVSTREPVELTNPSLPMDLSVPTSSPAGDPGGREGFIIVMMVINTLHPGYSPREAKLCVWGGTKKVYCHESKAIETDPTSELSQFAFSCTCVVSGAVGAAWPGC